MHDGVLYDVAVGHRGPHQVLQHAHEHGRRDRGKLAGHWLCIQHNSVIKYYIHILINIKHNDSCGVWQSDVQEVSRSQEGCRACRRVGCASGAAVVHRGHRRSRNKNAHAHTYGQQLEGRQAVCERVGVWVR